MDFEMRIDEELSLTLIQPKDAEELFALIEANREHLTPWLPWPATIQTVEDERRFAESVVAEHAAGRIVPCLIRRLGRIVGGMGLVIARRRLGAFEQASADIGYWLVASEQGRGVITRAAAALLDHGFGELGLRRITIRAEPLNRRSRAVPERLGFVHEGTLRGAGWQDGRRIDHELYAMLAEDWPAARAAYHAMRFQTNREPAGPPGR